MWNSYLHNMEIYFDLDHVQLAKYHITSIRIWSNVQIHLLLAWSHLSDIYVYIHDYSYYLNFLIFIDFPNHKNIWKKCENMIYFNILLHFQTSKPTKGHTIPPS